LILASHTSFVNMDTILEIGKKKDGKLTPINLHTGKKKQESTVEHLLPGSYSFIAHTQRAIGGGVHGPRFIECIVEVVSSSGQTIVHDINKLHAKQPTIGVEFRINTGEEGKFHVTYMTHALVAPMQFMAKLLKNSEEEEECLGTDQVQLLTLDVIIHELERNSTFKAKAFEEGMIRPFLYLVSMHPISRNHIADTLGVKIFGIPDAGDAHAEAWYIINHNIKGIFASTSSTVETLNPLKANPDWYKCLRRAVSEIYPTALKSFKSLETSQTLAVCKNSSDSTVSDIEVELLKNMVGSIHNSIKGDHLLLESVDKVLKSPDIIQFGQILRNNGLESEDILRGLVELCFVIRANKNLVNHKLAEEFSSNDSGEVQIDNTQESVSGLTAAEFLTAIKCQLLTGTWDPQKTSQTNKCISKGTSIASSWVVKTLILLPFAPMLVVPYTVYRHALKPFFGSKLEQVYQVISQMLLQRVLLASQNIRIESYY